MRRLAWGLLSLRRLRQDRTAAIAFVLLTLVTATVFATAPRLFTSVSQGGLQAEVAAAPATTRDLRLSQVTRPETMAGFTVDGVQGTGEGLEAQFPSVLRSIIGGTTYVVSTPLWQPVSGTAIESVISLRIQQGIEGHLRLVGGRWPTGATTSAPDHLAGAVPDSTVTTFEVAMSAQAAASLQVGVGDTIALEPAATDPLAQGRLLHAVITIVGLYAPLDPQDAYWLDDAQVEGDTVRVNGISESAQEHPQIDTAVVLSPDAYRALAEATAAGGEVVQGTLPLEYEWRYEVDAGRVQVADLDALTASLRRLASLYPTTVPAVGIGFGGQPATALQTGLVALLQGHQERWSVVQGVLTTAVVGAASVALASLAFVAVLASRRRRRTLVLTRGRGASRAQVLGSIGLECGLLAAPPALLGLGLARLVVPMTAVGHLTGVAAVAVGVLAAGTYGLAVAPSALGPLRGGPTGGRPGRTTLRRAVLEGLAVLAAVAAVALLRERGVVGSSAAVASTGPDLLVAALPALAGLAAGLVAIRVYPLPMGLLARLAGRRRDLVPALGLRRVTRGGGGAVLLVLLAACASAVFASAMLVHLDGAADALAWQQVGAPFQVFAPTGGLSLAMPLGELPGVTASAQGFQTAVTTSSGSVRTLLAVDAAAYQAIVAGSPVDPHLPSEMLAARQPQPLPAIISPSSADENHPLAVGDLFSIEVESSPVELRVSQIRPTFASIPAGDAFIVISRTQLTGLALPVQSASTFAFLKAPDAALGAIEQALAATRTIAQVEGRAQIAAATATTPAVAATKAGLALAVALAFAYAGLAVAAALALAGASRAVELAHLRVFGLTGRQVLALMVVEFGPLIVAAFLGGVALGLGLFVLMRDGLGLGKLVGSGVAVPLGLGLAQVLLLAGALVAIVALGIGAGVLAQRGAVPAQAIREGIE